MTLPEGFTINPNAADGKTACSDEEALIGTRLEAQCPEDVQGRNAQREQLGPAGTDTGLHLPRNAFARRPLPADSHRQRLQRPRQAGGLGDRRRTERGGHRLLPEPPADAVLGLQHALLRLRTGIAGDADALRHLRRQQHVHPVGQPARPSRPRPSSSRSAAVLAEAAAPARCARSHRPSAPGSPTGPPAGTRPSRSPWIDRTGNRTSPAWT